MTLRERLELLLPAALGPSRDVPFATVVWPLISHVWNDVPHDLPIPIRCALAEREMLRRVPIGMSPGELLAGRIDPKGKSEPWNDGKMPDDICYEGIRAHTALDADKLIHLGTGGIAQDIERRLADSPDEEARLFHKSALISLEGFRDLVARFRVLAEQLSLSADHPSHRAEMKDLADMLGRVPEQPAQTFHEAIQVVHLLFAAGWITVHSLYGTGRPDRLLYPFYRRDIEAGRLTRERALELICCQFILMNYWHDNPQPVVVGGLGPDGKDVTNDLTYLHLEADDLVGLVNPALALGVNEQTPDDLLDLAVRSLLKGRTKPALMNDGVIVEGLTARGVPFEEAVDYIHSTCIEITVIGRGNILVASPYINLLKPLEFALNAGQSMSEGTDPYGYDIVNRTSRLSSPDISTYTTFEDLFAEYSRQLAAKIEDASEMMSRVRRGRYERWAFPFASCFTADCIERGRDMERGGARYNWTETSNVGLANAVDSLMVIRKRVYEGGRCTLREIRDLMVSDQCDDTARRALAGGIARYGSDNAESDALAQRIVDVVYCEHAKHRDGLGDWFIPGFFAYITHYAMGASTAASPDGRADGDVLAADAGPSHQNGPLGPTAAIRSITSWDHRPGLGGITLNLRFPAGLFADSESRAKLIGLIRTYVKLGGFQMQVNAVDTELLRSAQREPEKHEGLLVRVAGYSAYFTRLEPELQEEVIARTEHAL